MRTVFEEICFMNRVTIDQVLKYQRFLHRRMGDIQSVIDHHFELIIDVMIQDHKDKFERERKRKKKEGKEGTLQEQLAKKVKEQEFLKEEEEKMKDVKIYNHEERLKKLIDFYDDLIRADKGRKENRTGVQEICRMMGSLSQSYFIFDSTQFAVAREIYFSLDDDNTQDIDKKEGA